MIDRLSTLITESVDPYRNQGLEELLLGIVEPGECILYLWRNRNTVVIGRNQHCRKECRVEALEAAGGRLARRLSGGGAVYHDLGNLNFTFLVRKEDYDPDRQTDVILAAVRALGIRAERTGRNDITADGRKFSGSAYYSCGDRKYHHGTIMIEASKDDMSNYLTVPEEKLRSNGVASVRSRVVNLSELAGGVTLERVEDALLSAFGTVYGQQPQPLSARRLDQEKLRELTDKFASWEWRMGREPDAACSVSRRFSWGGVELALRLSGGVIAEAAVYTDALDTALSPILADALTGAEFSLRGVTEALCAVYTQHSATTSMVRDVAALMEEYFDDDC